MLYYCSMKNINNIFDPPKDVFDWANSPKAIPAGAFEKLNIHPLANWAIEELVKEYKSPVDGNTKKMVYFILMTSWQQANLENRKKNSPGFNRPDYIENFIPLLIYNLRRNLYGVSKDEPFIEFLIRRGVEDLSYAS